VAATTTAPADMVERAIRRALFGLFADMFDTYLPVVVLAPAIAYFVAPGLSAGAASLVAAAIFAAALAGRALGAAISGRVAGRIGRRRAALLSVGGFGLVTVLIGCLPGHATWGAASVVFLVALRFVAGVLVGRPPALAASRAMRSSPAGERGENSARVMAGLPLALFTLAGLTLLVLQLAPSGDPSSAYSVWGWRIPFLAEGLVALACAVPLARRTAAPGTTDAFEADEATRAFEAARGDDGIAPALRPARDPIGRFAQVFVVMTGFWLTLNTVTAVLPGVLRGPVGLSDTQAALALIVAALANAGGYLVVGWLADRYGRRPFLVAWGLSAAALGTFVYWTLLRFTPPSVPTVIVLAAATVVLVGPCWAMIAAYAGERLPVSGAPAWAFGLAAVLPAFHAVYQDLLGRVMDEAYTVLPLLVIGGVLIAIGGALGPETRDVDVERRRARDRAPRFTRDVVADAAAAESGQVA
jgi:MFS family permease